MEMDKSSTEPSNFDFFFSPLHLGKTAIKAGWIYLSESVIVGYLKMYRDSYLPRLLLDFLCT